MGAIDPNDVQKKLDAVILAMKAENTWEIARPAEEAFAAMGAFGGNTMAFVQWLRWVFVPNVEGVIAKGGPWPKESSVSVRAVREGDTDPIVAALVTSLSDFDALFNPKAPEPPPASTTSPAAEPYERSRTLLDQKNYDGALEAIEAAIAHDPAFPNAHNFAGWILTARPTPTPEALEAAVVHFRESLRLTYGPPEAFANLACALIALGRDDEAIATAEREAKEGAFAAQAHNWLAWYFTDKKDLARALPHGREATKLLPKWGLAWGTLATTLDRMGKANEALEAYLEGLASGGISNPGFVHRRALELERAMAARGETMTMNPKGAFAERTGRANDAGRAIQRALATMPEFATARTLVLGRARPVPEGDIPTAWIGTVVGDRAIIHALVRDLGSFATLHVLMHRTEGRVLRAVPMAGGDVSVAAHALAEWLRGGGDADATSVNPLDVAVMLLDLLTLAVPVARGFRLSTSADDDGANVPATASVLEHNLGVSAAAHPEGGVRIELAREQIGAKPVFLDAPTMARFVELQPEIVAATRRAFDARAKRIETLTADALVEGDRLRLRRTVEGLGEAGEIATLVAERYVPHEGITMYTFANARQGQGLKVQWAEDSPFVMGLDQYFERA